METTKIRCNNCYSIFDETDDNQITECNKCKTGEYLMEKFQEENTETLELQKVGTWLPVFSGFYNTIWENDSDEEMELENINEKREEKGLDPVTWDDVEWDYVGYRKEVVEGITNAVGHELEKLGLISATKLEKLVSPHEYNFKNDSIDVEFSLTPKNVSNIKTYLQTHLEAFSKYLKSRYTSYDGFLSSYSSEIQDWLGDLDSAISHQHKLGSILHFILLNEEEDMEMDLYEDLRSNGVEVHASNYSALIGEESKS